DFFVSFVRAGIHIPGIGPCSALPELKFLDFSGGRTRQLGNELDVARNHEARHAGHEIIDQVTRRDRDLGLENDKGHHFLLCVFRWDRHDRTLKDSGMPVDLFLDLNGRYILATSSYGILGTIDKVKVSILVLLHEVATMEPEIAPGLDRLFGTV